MTRTLGAWSVCLALTAPASAQTPAGGEFRVNTVTTESQEAWTRPVMESDGDFIVAWTSAFQDGSGSGVFGQRFAASGAARGSEFQINTYTEQPQIHPAVAVGSSGDFVVVWTSYGGGGGPNIKGQRFAASGSAIGGEFQVNTFTTGFQDLPHVGRAADGGFVVSWFSGVLGGLPWIAARRFDTGGNPIGDEFVVNTYTTWYQIFGDLAVEPNGNFVIVWAGGYYCGDRCEVFGQRFDASGNRLGGEFQVNSYTTGRQRVPSVSVSPAGDFVVAWESPGDGSRYGIFARRFDPSGNPVGNDFLVNTGTAGGQYATFGAGQIAHDARGNFVVTWMSCGDTGYCVPHGFAQRFDASGSRRGAEFRISTNTTSLQGGPSVASDPVGNFIITWNDSDGSAQGVFAQRFGGLGPSALAVDGRPGNLVWEPGEAVPVRPSWRNFNGAAQTFSATLTGIAGPVGATYTITDGVGDYGTVADG